MQDLINQILFYDYAIEHATWYHEFREYEHLRRLALRMLRDMVE